ncbi:MAG: glutamine-hydrolyzing carbamoyl-phosphate synthase small subunit [Thermoplasmata archaeon]
MGSSTPVTTDPEPTELVGTLFLEDGTRFDGQGTGAPASATGEVVFTTGMAGYPESLTDPSYRGQILVFTYPLLGNYGVPSTTARDGDGLPTFVESDHIQVRGMVARGLTTSSHWGQAQTLPGWLRSEGVPGITGIDTRRLTQHLRSQGVLRGVIDVSPFGHAPSNEELVRRLRSAPLYGDEPLVAEVAVSEPAVYRRARGPWVAVIDCGVKASILRALLARGLTVVRLPPDTAVPERWDGHRVAGVVVGNGPGDPAALETTIEGLARLPRRGIPTLGVCLGHQLLALAHGGTTFKLKYGHRGQNKTVTFPDGRALIVSENHGFAVDATSLDGTPLKPWAINPDDGTLEGLRDSSGSILALQGHPEGHPGPQEAGFVFDLFADRVRQRAR